MKQSIYILLVALLSSCASHFGNMGTGSSYLTNGEFSIDGLAIGKAKTTKVLGFGGLNKDALVLEAKKDLFNSTFLSKNQAFGNFTVDYKYSFFILVFITEVTVSYEIINFEPNNNKPKIDVGLLIPSSEEPLDAKLLDALWPDDPTVTLIPPPNPENRILKFRYRDGIQQGEVIRETDEGFLIRALDKKGFVKGYSIPIADIINN